MLDGLPVGVSATLKRVDLELSIPPGNLGMLFDVVEERTYNQAQTRFKAELAALRRSLTRWWFGRSRVAKAVRQWRRCARHGAELRSKICVVSENISFYGTPR